MDVVHFKIYVSCALSQAPEEFRNAVSVLKDRLRILGIEVLEFAFVNGAPKEGVNVYEYDMISVEGCDLFVPIATLPSIGLGMELERAASISKPTLTFAERGVYVTQILRDMLEKFGHKPVIEYDDMEEIVAHVQKYIEEILQHSAPLFAEA